MDQTTYSVGSLREQGLALLEADLRFLMETFAEALERLGEGEIAASLPWQKKAETRAKGSSDRKIGQAYSIAFQLLNIVEERTASRVRRMREAAHGPAAERGLWAAQLQRMLAAGLRASDIRQALGKQLTPLRPNARRPGSGIGRSMI
jgi:phosphoenolpyruvate carboxylase